MNSINSSFSTLVPCTGDGVVHEAAPAAPADAAADAPTGFIVSAADAESHVAATAATGNTRSWSPDPDDWMTEEDVDDSDDCLEINGR